MSSSRGLVIAVVISCFFEITNPCPELEWRCLQDQGDNALRDRVCDLSGRPRSRLRKELAQRSVEKSTAPFADALVLKSQLGAGALEPSPLRHGLGGVRPATHRCRASISGGPSASSGTRTSSGHERLRSPVRTPPTHCMTYLPAQHISRSAKAIAAHVRPKRGPAVPAAAWAAVGRSFVLPAHDSSGSCTFLARLQYVIRG